MINNIDNVPSIIKTERQEIHFISPKNVKEATQLYYKITEEIATKISSNNKKYGEITKKEAFQSIPVPEFKIKSSMDNKLSIENWRTCQSKKDLKSLKLTELKTILTQYNVTPKGNKSKIIKSVWEILHPELVDTYPYINNRSEDSTEEIINLLKTMETIHIHNTTGDIYSKPSKSLNEQIDNYTEYKYLSSKNWVFSETLTSFEFKGSINTNKLIYTYPPLELIDLYE